MIKFEDGDFSLDVKVDPSKDTVWLTVNQIALLFDRDEKTIRKHINNALDEECDFSTVAKFETVQLEGNRSVKRSIEHYNLDIIISEEIPSNIKLIYNDLYHDRFLIIDEAVYIIGTSFNEIGKKRFVIMRVKDITKNQVLKK